LATPIPATLDSTALTRRLAELAGEERGVQVEFLLHLDEFDRRRAWVELGFPSLWEYALRALHLREGAARRRITAMRLVRRFPLLVDTLRDGRLCLSTVGLLGPVLTDDNLRELVEAAAFKTKAEVERLVAGIAPRAPPKEGIRKLPARAPVAEATVALPLTSSPTSDATPAPALPALEPEGYHPAPAADAVSAAAPRMRPALHPVAADTYSLRVTLDAAFKAQIDELTALLGHKLPNGDVGAVLRVAVQCAIEKYGKRRGAKDVRQRAPAAAQVTGSDAGPEHTQRASQRVAIPAAVRREVWKRDGGQCTFRGEDGQRCPARARLEFDHVIPVALGGESTMDNLRIACTAHNVAYAERVFGREHMARFRRDPGAASPGESARCAHRAMPREPAPPTLPGM
jgi:hypothetical protein